MKNLVLPIIAAGAALFATVSVVRTQPVREVTDPPSAPPASGFARTVAAVGLVEASTENISIGTPLSGVVAEVVVAVGQPVKAGAPLFRLDSRHLEASLAVQRSQLGAARARLLTAEAGVSDLADRLSRARKLRGETVISEDELVRTEFALRTAEARSGESRAEITAAESSVKAVETEIARSTIAAPVDATVLQVKVRPGEFAAAGAVGVPLVLLGNLSPLHIRVDIDEHEAWRVRPGAKATGHVRGNAALSSPLAFVRFEPFVVPKRSLTGDSTERVDTRVLQAVYRIERSDLRLFAGQQMDVFIDARGVALAGAR